MTPAEFRKFIVDETEKWANVIKFAGIKPVMRLVGTARRDHARFPSMKDAVALHCLDLKWKQRIKVTCLHEMIDIESVSGPNRAWLYAPAVRNGGACGGCAHGRFRNLR